MTTTTTALRLCAQCLGILCSRCWDSRKSLIHRPRILDSAVFRLASVLINTLHVTLLPVYLRRDTLSVSSTTKPKQDEALASGLLVYSLPFQQYPRPAWQIWDRSRAGISGPIHMEILRTFSAMLCFLTSLDQLHRVEHKQ